MPMMEVALKVLNFRWGNEAVGLSVMTKAPRMMKALSARSD
jgi:hypothetical protein